MVSRKIHLFHIFTILPWANVRKLWVCRFVRQLNGTFAASLQLSIVIIDFELQYVFSLQTIFWIQLSTCSSSFLSHCTVHFLVELECTFQVFVCIFTSRFSVCDSLFAHLFTVFLLSLFFFPRRCLRSHPCDAVYLKISDWCVLNIFCNRIVCCVVFDCVIRQWKCAFRV